MNLIYKTELESIEAFKEGKTKGYLCFYEDGFYEIINTDRGFCGEDKLHWSDPVCITQDEDDAFVITFALNKLEEDS